MLHLSLASVCKLAYISAKDMQNPLFHLEALYVTAWWLYRQKDVIFDGTMMWAPFVEQTIAMVRDYKRNYRRGPGYKQHPGGSTTEQ